MAPERMQHLRTGAQPEMRKKRAGEVACMHGRTRPDAGSFPVPRSCACMQMGHQAAQCTSGTVNWRQIYGDKAFILRGPVYWSEELARRKAREVDVTDLEKRAREFAQVCA